jgi:hypothetical protein
MTKETTRSIAWPKVVAEIEDLSGIPRKQIDEVSNKIVKGLESIIEKNQPKRDGEEVCIETPFAGYRFSKHPAQNTIGHDGKQIARPTCIGANISIPRNFIDKANIGLIDKVTEDAEKKKSKTA